jgi:hypothetical protein
LASGFDDLFGQIKFFELKAHWTKKRNEFRNENVEQRTESETPRTGGTVTTSESTSIRENAVMRTDKSSSFGPSAAGTGSAAMRRVCHSEIHCESHYAVKTAPDQRRPFATPHKSRLRVRGRSPRADAANMSEGGANSSG